MQSEEYNKYRHRKQYIFVTYKWIYDSCKIDPDINAVVEQWTVTNEPIETLFSDIAKMLYEQNTMLKDDLLNEKLTSINPTYIVKNGEIIV